MSTSRLHIATRTNAGGSGCALVYEVSTAGVLTYKATLDTDTSGEAAQVLCSLDGSVVVVVKLAGAAGTGLQIYVQGGTPYTYSLGTGVSLTPANTIHAVISPDGSNIVYANGGNLFSLHRSGSTWSAVNNISLGSATFPYMGMSGDGKWVLCQATVSGVNKAVLVAVATNGTLSLAGQTTDNAFVTNPATGLSGNRTPIFLSKDGTIAFGYGGTHETEASVAGGAFATSIALDINGEALAMTDDGVYVYSQINSIGAPGKYYKRSGVSSYPTLSTTSVNNPNFAAFKPNTSEFLAFAFPTGTTSLVDIWSRTGDTFAYVSSIPGANFSNGPNWLAWSSIDTYGNLASTLQNATALFTIQGRLDFTTDKATASFAGTSQWNSLAVQLDSANAAISGNSQHSSFIATLQNASAAFAGNAVVSKLAATLRNDAAAFSGQIYAPGVYLFPVVSESLVGASSVSSQTIARLFTQLALHDSPTPAVSAFATLIQQVQFSDLLLVVREVVLQEHINATSNSAFNVAKVAQVIEAMLLTGVVATRLQAIVLLSTALVLNESTQGAFAVNALDSIALTDNFAQSLIATSALLETALLTSSVTSTRTVVLLVGEGVALSALPRSQIKASESLHDELDFDVVVFVDGLPYDGWVVNTTNLAPSEYSNFPFNAMCRLGQRYYGTSEQGLYLLDGDTDDGDPIMASIVSGELDFNSPELKRIERAYVGRTPAGRMVMKITATENGVRTERWYGAVNPSGDTAEQVRFKFGRGVRTQYMQFELVNADGDDFNPDRIHFDVVELSRRI